MNSIALRAAVAAALTLTAFSGPAQTPTPAPQPQEPTTSATRDLTVTVGKSVILDSPVQIERVSVANGAVAEAVAVTPREILVNGKTPGETSLIIWQLGGNRLVFDLLVRATTTKLDGIRREIESEFPGQNITVELDNDTVFLRGTVKDMTSADRASAIAGVLGKTVNLLRVNVPATDPQILLKVRFANVDRAASQELGVNLFSNGAANTIGSTSTGAFSPPQAQTGGNISLTDALNVFLFRRDINLGATIRALQSRRLLEILAEPNVLAINGHEASFLAGGEFPYPTLQGGGGGLGAVTIQFREFGVRIKFLPALTPRGTIRLQVTPEVSSLDFANGLVFQGFTIPALSTRRVQTEIELEAGQSFAIGGLLDNRVTESLSKVPGLGDIPLLGKLFQSRSVTRNKTELIVLVTPELVRPIPADQKPPEIAMPLELMKEGPHEAPRTPGLAVTGPVPVKAPQATMPIEELIESRKPPQTGQPAYTPQIQFVPMIAPQPVQPPPAAPPKPPATPPANEGRL